MKITVYTSPFEFQKAIQRYTKDFSLAVLAEDPFMLKIASHNLIDTYEANYKLANSISPECPNAHQRALDFLSSRGYEDQWIQQHRFLYLRTGDPRRDWNKNF